MKQKVGRFNDRTAYKVEYKQSTSQYMTILEHKRSTSFILSCPKFSSAT